MKKEFWQKALTFFKSPNRATVWVNGILTVIAVALSLTVVAVGYTGIFSYFVYVIAAVTLAYFIYTIVLVAPKIKAWSKSKLRSRKFTKNLTEDYSFRTIVFGVCSVVINLSFVVFNTVFAALTKSAWYASLAGYYFLLSFLRVGVFYMEKSAKKKGEGYRLAQLKNYLFCGVALFALDVAMSAAVTLMVMEQKPVRYTEIAAIVFATFSAYKITLAIWNIFKAKRTKDPFIQSFRNVGLVDAAISLLSLQTTLVSTFSAEGENMLWMNALTGAFVCLLAIGMGAYMIYRANTRRKKEGNHGRQEI